MATAAHVLSRAWPARAGVMLLLGLFISSCGGGGGGSSSTSAATPPAPPPPPPTNASPGGIWTGVDSFTAQPITGLVTETGEFHFIRSDGTQFFGTLTTSVNNLSGSLTGVTAVGFVFPDGSATGTGTLTGTVQARTSLSGTVNFRTAGGTANASNVSVTFSPVYDRASSLATIAGSYTNNATAGTPIVNTLGVLFYQDPVTKCVINGAISIINPTYNVYRVEYSFASCVGTWAFLNGTSARGLATLDNSVSPERLIVAVANATAGYSVFWAFPRLSRSG